MERGGKCVTNQLLAGLPLEANRILGSSSSSHSQQFAWVVMGLFLGPWEDQYQKSGEQQGVQNNFQRQARPSPVERVASFWWLSSSNILKAVKSCISRFEVQRNHWSGVIILSTVVHRPPRGLTRDAVEEHGGEPLLEYDGDPLDQVVDHLLFVYFKFDDCDKDFKSES